MELREVSPDDLHISDLNERVGNAGDEADAKDLDPEEGESSFDTSELEESVERNGVLNPPLVRENETGYEVFVGQRRAIAAQAVGLDSVPVLVTGWEDEEALAASISENVEAFSKKVGLYDRSKAIYRLASLAKEGGDERAFTDNGVPRPSWVAERLGIQRRTAQFWVEIYQPVWRETDLSPVHIETDEKDSGESVTVESGNDSQSENKQIAESLGENTLATIRQITAGEDDPSEAAQELVQQASEEELSQRDLKTVREYTGRGESVDTAVEKVAETKRGEYTRKKVRFDGKTSNAIREFAQDRGTSDGQIIREAVSDYLESEGYL